MHRKCNIDYSSAQTDHITTGLEILLEMCKSSFTNGFLFKMLKLANLYLQEEDLH